MTVQELNDFVPGVDISEAWTGGPDTSAEWVVGPIGQMIRRLAEIGVIRELGAASICDSNMGDDWDTDVCMSWQLSEYSGCPAGTIEIFQRYNGVTGEFFGPSNWYVRDAASWEWVKIPDDLVAAARRAL